ncbi:tyrosine-type recombinase/integrase [Chloroflexota bacterium]
MEVAIKSNTNKKYLGLFLQSRQAMQVSPGTMQFYRVKLGRFFAELNPNISQRQDIEAFLLHFKNPGNRHAYYRAIRTFYRWREETFGLPSPMQKMKAPKIPKVILPVLTKEKVLKLIDSTVSIRNKAIISLLTESGLRLSEATNIKQEDIDWKDRIIKVRAKGQKEVLSTFGDMTAKYLKEWLAQYQPVNNIWGMDKWGIISMLRRLEKATGLKCNPHVFRRTFACLLRQAGLNTLTIKDLGGWTTTFMVEHYTRSMGFHDSLKFYKGPLS